VTLGRKLNNLMVQKGMTIGDLCDSCSANPVVIFGVLNDIRQPSDLLLKRMAWALNTEVEEIKHDTCG